jgi:hypothetical protein
MKSVTKKLLTSFFFFAVTYSAFSQNNDIAPINVVTSAVPFLKISPDSRSGGMGDLGVATSPDANAQFYNVAKYAFAKNSSGLGMTYTPWLKDLGLNDVYLASLAGYYKLDDKQAISGSLRYFSLGDIQFTDFLGNDLNSFRPREFALDAGYSRILSDKLSIGAAIRFINSNLAGGQSISGVSYQPGNSVAGDIGLYYNSLSDDGSGLSMGLAMTNLGAKIGYTSNESEKDYLPANLTLGAVFTTVSNEVSKLSFGIDIHKLMVPTPPAITGQFEADSISLFQYRNKGVISSWFSSFGDAPGGFSEELKEYSLSLGGEFTYQEQFSLRAGYFYENEKKGNRQFVSLGAGFKSSTLGFNFSYIIPSGSGVNRNPLSNTMRFSLIFDFGSQESY